MRKCIKIVTIILLVVIMIVLIIYKSNNEPSNSEEIVNNQIENEINTEINTEENNEVSSKNTSDENLEIEELKQQYNMAGDSEIYNVETEKDGRKVITVKPNVNFKVAFAGMIKNEKPNFKELDLIFEKKAPTKKGIWIKKEDRKKIVSYLNDNKKLNSEYEVDNEGYLQIKEKQEESNIDKKIEELINGENQYIFCISSVCYIVEPVAGEIVDNAYNELEQYQTYEYFKDEGRMIIFITENKDSKMTQDEIFESIIDLIEVNKN